MLGTEFEMLWKEYLRAEQVRVRPEMMSALDRFIDRLLQLPPAQWHPWAKEIAADVSDRGAETPVRFPLFRRVLLPALVDGVLRGEPGCARWLASFESLLLHTPEARLPSKLQTAAGLLAEAVRIDPTDQLARKRLVERLASYLEYTLHELPSGVLFGMNGATIEQCAELQSCVADFRAHVAALGEENRHADLIHECAFHYAAYADYLRASPVPGGYEGFLSGRATG
jgi:hypothetical protein